MRSSSTVWLWRTPTKRAPVLFNPSMSPANAPRLGPRALPTLDPSSDPAAPPLPPVAIESIAMLGLIWSGGINRATDWERGGVAKGRKVDNTDRKAGTG